LYSFLRRGFSFTRKIGRTPILGPCKYQTHNLESLLSDDFIFERTCFGYTNNKNSFIVEYIPSSKTLNARFKLLKVVVDKPSKVFLVEEQSDYLKYLGVTYPTWKMTIVLSNKLVKKVIIDSTDSWPKYQAELLKKGEDFERWVKKKYPNETEAQLNKTYSHLMIRVKEYASRK
jgi:hypothetical protein